MRILTTVMTVVGIAACSTTMQAAQSRGTDGPSAKIYVLAAYSCNSDDQSDENIIQQRQRNQSFILNSFAQHVPKDRLIKYGDAEWPDKADANKSEIGFGKADIFGALRNCPAGPNDTIVFYWNGHGGGAKHELVMPDGRGLVRSHIVSEVQAKNVRLAAVITDTCAADVVPEIAIPAPSIQPPKEIADLYDELFIQPRGLLNLSSAQPGQFAMRRGPGSLFTLALAAPPTEPSKESNTGYLWVHAKERKSWDAVIPELQSNLSALFQTAYPDGYEGQMDQHIWAISLPSQTQSNTTCVERSCILKRLLQRLRRRRCRTQGCF